MEQVRVKRLFGFSKKVLPDTQSVGSSVTKRENSFLSSMLVNTMEILQFSGLRISILLHFHSTYSSTEDSLRGSVLNPSHLVSSHLGFPELSKINALCSKSCSHIGNKMKGPQILLSSSI